MGHSSILEKQKLIISRSEPSLSLMRQKKNQTHKQDFFQYHWAHRKPPCSGSREHLIEVGVLLPITRPVLLESSSLEQLVPVI